MWIVSQQEVVTTDMVNAVGVAKHPEKEGVLNVLVEVNDDFMESEIPEDMWGLFRPKWIN